MSANVTKDELRKEIHLILKDADLTSTSSKAVRLQLEKKLKINLLDRKKEVDELVMEYVNPPGDDDDEDGEDESGSESESEEEEKSSKRKPPPKRSASASKKPAKKSKHSSESENEESGSDGAPSDEEEDSDDEPKKKSAAKGKKGRGRKKGSDDSGSDDDWKKPKPVKKKKGTGKGNGYTRPCTLSPDLAKLVGADSLPRHEVVKKMWAIIKERNLYDPKNKQFAICDPDMYKVIGVKRFRAFGIMKYLKNHLTS